MNNFDEIKTSKEIKIIDDNFQKMVLAGVGCNCKTYVAEMKQTIVADYYIEVDIF